MEEAKTDQKQGNKEERSFELRSEKVRSIIGQIPSSLVQYGITAIGLVLLCLFAVAHFLPYKQVYSGVATIYEIPQTASDSTEMHILLRFEQKRANEVSGATLILQTDQTTFQGSILALSTERDILERQQALCRFRTEDIQPIENQTVDFYLVQSSSNLLQKLLGDICL